MPSQACRLLLGAAAARGYAILSRDVPGTYMRAPSDPRYRMTMRQPAHADGMYAVSGNICIIRRAM